jgi:predicted molibdopterin-dependent oxidoreductase YjgC
VQRIKRAVPAPGEALPRWELAGALITRLGGPAQPTSARELFLKVAAAVPDLAGADFKALGGQGKALPIDDPGAKEPALGKPQVAVGV